MKADQREDDLKQTHNNYMLQVQSLINQKAIGSQTKGHQTERKTAQKEGKTEPGRDQREDSAEQGEKEPNRKECRNCGEIFYTENIRKEYCSDKCKTQFFRKNRKVIMGTSY